MGNHPPGYRPNGDGPANAAFGRDPVTGRAYKRNGEVRKPRTVRKGADAAIAAVENQRKAMAGLGRKVLAGIPGGEEFMEAHRRFRALANEARGFADEERREAKRLRLEEALRDLDAKGDEGAEWLAEYGDLSDEAASAFAKVGEAVMEAAREGGTPDEEALARIVEEAIPASAREALASAPDPYAHRRRNAEEDEDEDDDSL